MAKIKRLGAGKRIVLTPDMDEKDGVSTGNAIDLFLPAD